LADESISTCDNTNTLPRPVERPVRLGGCMASLTLKRVKENIIDKFRKDHPVERLSGKVFTVWLLDKYARLLYSVYRAKKG
jgi:hypothetical protein